MPTNVLIIDDEPDTVSAAMVILRANDFTVDSATDPKQGLQKIDQQPPHLILLDINLGEMDGFDVCKRLKSNPDTKHIPIVMLSAHAEEPNIVQALNLGADDFIRKPIWKDELLARVKAVLRRSEPHEEEIKRGPLQVGVKSRRVLVNGKSITLEPKEFQLLVLLARKEGRVVTRKAVASHVWSDNLDPASRTIDVRVNELRKKLGENGDWIKTLKGIGYRMEIE